jgi:phosphohistidine phosphatase
VAEDLNRSVDPVMLVGHLPFMEKLAGYMLTGDADQAVIDFNNAGIVCLKQEDERWQVEWILSAEIAGIKA